MKFLNSLPFILAASFILIPVASHAQLSNTQDSTVTTDSADLAVDGYCPVCIMKGELVKGNSRYSATYKGKKYVFDTNEDRRMFLENPELYTQGLNLKYQQMKK